MITIKFNNSLYIPLTQMQLKNILESLQSQVTNLSDYLEDYSFSSPYALYNLIHGQDNLVIYYHQTVPEDFNILNPQNFETVLKGLEQLYIYIPTRFPFITNGLFPGYAYYLYLLSNLGRGLRKIPRSSKPRIRLEQSPKFS